MRSLPEVDRRPLAHIAPRRLILPVNVALVIAVAALAVGAVGVVLNVVVAIRGQGSGRRRFGYPRQWPAPTIAVLLLLVGATFLPWVTGSAVGVSLPGTVWGLPWIRWFVVIPVLSFGLLLSVGLVLHRGFVRVLTALALLTCAVVAAGVLVLAAFAQHISRLTFLSDTLLRVLRNRPDLLPVVRVGPGSILFLISAAVGTFALAIGPRVPDPGSLEMGSPTRVKAVDDPL